MVRIVNRSQSGNRREWLKELERQKSELEEKRQREKDLSRNISDLTLSEQNYKEFGGRRRHYNDIIKLEHESLPKIPLDHQVEEKRVPFSGAVRIKEQAFHKTKSWLDSSDNHLNLEYKLALEKQIQEKKERIKKEKEAERLLELTEISRLSSLEKQESNQSYRLAFLNKDVKQVSNDSFQESKKPKIEKKFQSKIPKLKYFTSTNQRIEDILPAISKFSDLIGRTSQLSYTSSSKKRDLSIKNPPPVLLKEKQIVRKPVKIVQKFPVRTTDLTTPPSLGERCWPAGSRAAYLPAIENTNTKIQNTVPRHKSLAKKEHKVVLIPFQHLIDSKKESQELSLDESLERRTAIKELQQLWSDYEHEKRAELP